MLCIQFSRLFTGCVICFADINFANGDIFGLTAFVIHYIHKRLKIKHLIWNNKQCCPVFATHYIRYYAIRHWKGLSTDVRITSQSLKKFRNGDKLRNGLHSVWLMFMVNMLNKGLMLNKEEDILSMVI